jgi:hypothetical protein
LVSHEGRQGYAATMQNDVKIFVFRSGKSEKIVHNRALN